MCDADKKGMTSLCRHCHTSKSNRSRGLCWTCFYTPGVRDLYPSTRDYATRRLPDCTRCGHANAAKEAGAFEGVCGTCRRLPAAVAVYHERVADLERRAELGLPLFGPVTDLRAKENGK